MLDTRLMEAYRAILCWLSVNASLSYLLRPGQLRQQAAALRLLLQQYGPGDPRDRTSKRPRQSPSKDGGEGMLISTARTPCVSNPDGSQTFKNFPMA